MKKRKGFALIVSIFVVIVFSVLGAVAASMLSGESISAIKDLRSMQALHIAEAGIRYAIAKDLDNLADWTTAANFTKNLSPGYFSVNYLSATSNTVTVQVKGVVGGVERIVSVNASHITSGSGAFSYAIYAGNQGGASLNITNNSIIDGDFYYNGDVTMTNNAKLINGTMYCNNLNLQNSSTVETYEPLPNPQVPPPSFETTYYDQMLSETTKGATSSLNLWNSTLNLSGQTQYYTSINICGNSIVNGPGTLVATSGDFNLSNTAQIGDNVKIIVKGNAIFSNTVKVGNTCEVISKGSIYLSNSQDFPKDDVLFSYGDIQFNNSTAYYGSVLAPSGTISNTNTIIIRGIIYGKNVNFSSSPDIRGSVSVNSVGYISNSARITYDPTAFPANWPVGLEGGRSGAISSISNWREVF